MCLGQASMLPWFHGATGLCNGPTLTLQSQWVPYSPHRAAYHMPSEGTAWFGVSCLCCILSGEWGSLCPQGLGRTSHTQGMKTRLLSWCLHSTTAVDRAQEVSGDRRWTLSGPPF